MAQSFIDRHGLWTEEQARLAEEIERRIEAENVPPARLPGYQLCNFLQKVPVFLKEFDQGRYQSYWDLIMTDFIGPDRPRRDLPFPEFPFEQ